MLAKPLIFLQADLRLAADTIQFIFSFPSESNFILHSTSHHNNFVFFLQNLKATVKAARAFFKEMDEMEKRVRVKKPKSSDADAQQLYVSAYDILDKYLDLVELPPLESGHYDQEFDTLVGETARIT